MTSRRRDPWRVLLHGVLLCTGLACTGAQSASASRTVLMDPGAAHWRTRAPDRFRVRVETTKGPFVLEIFRDWAPIGADHFHNLVSAGYYNDSRFSRTVPNFIVQFGIAGDPAVTAVWKDRRIQDDAVRQSNVRGTIAFAMTGPHTRTTQLFISLVDLSRLDAGGFSPLGRVIEGMDVVDRLYNGYGETSGGGLRAGGQQRVIAEGNAYLDTAFPKLDRLIRATIVR